MMTGPSGAPPPTTLARYMAILRQLAATSPSGSGLTQIAQRTGLPHPTVHRLLHQLSAQRLVRQIPSTKRYVLGVMAFELGLAAAHHYDLPRVCRPMLARLARDTGDTVYLTVRSGNEAVCVDRTEGSAPIRVVSLQVGSRRPLAVGAGGLAIYCALPAVERESIARELAATLESDWNTSPNYLRTLVDRVHADGYTLIRDRITPGVTAVGQPIVDTLGRPFAAVSVAMVHRRMTNHRIPAVAAELQSARRAIEESIRGVEWADYATDRGSAR
jgi:DNA-binding IclR family transcriptional regulator